MTHHNLLLLNSKISYMFQRTTQQRLEATLWSCKPAGSHCSYLAYARRAFESNNHLFSFFGKWFQSDTYPKLSIDACCNIAMAKFGLFPLVSELWNREGLYRKLPFSKTKKSGLIKCCTHIRCKRKRLMLSIFENTSPWWSYLSVAEFSHMKFTICCQYIHKTQVRCKQPWNKGL